MKNKYTLIGFALIAAILFGWMYFMSPSKEELAKRQQVQDSINRVNRERDSLRQLEQRETEVTVQLADTTATTELDSAALALKQANE